MPFQGEATVCCTVNNDASQWSLPPFDPNFIPWRVSATSGIYLRVYSKFRFRLFDRGWEEDKEGGKKKRKGTVFFLRRLRIVEYVITVNDETYSSTITKPEYTLNVLNVARQNVQCAYLNERIAFDWRERGNLHEKRTKKKRRSNTSYIYIYISHDTCASLKNSKPLKYCGILS